MDGLLSLLLFAALFYVMMRFGCGAHMVHGHHGSQGGHDSHSGSTEKTIDPVCGMEVAPDQGYGKMHGGRLYRFCSRNCLDRFEADPNNYVTALKETS